METFQIRHADPVEVFECGRCPYKRKMKEYVGNHYRNHYDPNIPILKCHLCGYETRVTQNIEIHLRVHEQGGESEVTDN